MSFPYMPDPNAGDNPEATEYTGHEEQEASPSDPPAEEEPEQPVPSTGKGRATFTGLT